MIAVAGGKGRAVVALEQKSGRTIWAAHSFRNAYSSPLLVKARGRDRVIVLGAQQILSIDPGGGESLWVLPLGTDAGTAFSAMPLYDAISQTLVISHSGGSTALRLDEDASESDTPRKAGGLMSWAASKAVGLVV